MKHLSDYLMSSIFHWKAFFCHQSSQRGDACGVSMVEHTLPTSAIKGSRGMIAASQLCSELKEMAFE